MVDLEILKNPILIGVLLGAITYLYMWYEEKNRREKNPKTRKRAVNIVTPVVVAIIAWFISSNYFSNSTIKKAQPTIETKPEATPIIGGKTKQYLVTSKGSIDTDGSLGSASYHIISKKNVRLPPIDVFIDLAKF